MEKEHYLYKYIHHRQMNVKEFSESLGLTRADRLYNVLNGKNRLSPKLANLICSIYNDVNYEWLITGEGEMIKMQGRSIDGDHKAAADLKDPKEDSVTQQDFDGQMLVEFRDLSVAAGPLNQTIDPSTSRRMLVPREYDRGEYLVVKVNGKSMEDGTEFSIPNGANILIKKFYLENGEKLPIRDNLFVIDAKDGQALKQIIEHNPEAGYIICHSYNPEFKDYKVDMRDVYGIYIFRKIIGHRPPVRDIN